MTERTRREVLGAAAALGASGLAGCVDEFTDSPDSDPDENAGDGDDGTDTNGDDTNGDDTNGDELTVEEVTVETVEANCIAPDDGDVEVQIDGNVVEVSGVISAPNPCHEAVADADVSGTTLSVTVDVEKTDEEDCIQCVGSLEYDVRVELSGEGVESVDVSHDGDGEQPTVDASTTPESEPEPRVEDFETVETRCASGGGDGGLTVNESDGSTDGENNETTTGESGERTDDESIDASVDGETLTIQGVIGASNPCHVAKMADLSTEGSTLSAVVEVESDLEEGEMCQQCLGEVHYEGTIDLDGVELDSVTVEHRSGEKHTVELE